jgi:ligand-binding sensor domain-containing protein
MNYQDKTLHLYKATGDSTGLPHSNVNDIGEDHDGYIWVGTNGGLCRLDPGTNLFTTFTMNDGLPSNKISGIMVDRLNRIWMATSRGLVVS